MMLGNIIWQNGPTYYKGELWVKLNKNICLSTQTACWSLWHFGKSNHAYFFADYAMQDVKSDFFSCQDSDTYIVQQFCVWENMFSFLSDGLFLLVKVSNMKECRQKQAYSGWWDNLIFATLNFCLCMPGMYYMCTYEIYPMSIGKGLRIPLLLLL